jgi:valyl-tRNA synthetase
VSKSYEEEWNIMREVMNVIKSIRNTRAEKKVPDNKKISGEILIKGNKENYLTCVSYIQKLTTMQSLKIVENKEQFSENSIELTFNDIVVNLPLDSMVDMEEEKLRREKEIARLTSEIERSERMLSNEGFVAKAPEKLIAQEKEKLERNKALKADLLKNM